MKLLRLVLERFGSFEQRTEFVFPDGPGLFFMRGRNDADPRLDANGVGKSTIWAALTWLLFERTVKGLRAGDVCTWGEKGGTEVTLDFQLSADSQWPLRITRTWGPNSWTLHDSYEGIADDTFEPDVDLVQHPDNPVLAELRCTLAQWLQTVVIASSEPMFLDMRAEAKTAFMADVLGLQQWEDRAARASKQAQDQDEAVRQLEQTVARLEGQVQEAERYAAANVHEAQRWDDNHRADVLELSGHFEELERREHALAKDLRNWRQVEEQWAEGMKPVRQQWLDLAERVRDAEMRAVHATTVFDAVVDRLAVVQRDAEQLADTKRCPTCGQELGRDHYEHAGRHVVQAAQDSIEEVNLLETIATLADEDLHWLRGHEQEMRDQHNKLADVLDGAHHKVDDVQRELSDVRRKLDAAQQRADELSRRTNPYKAATPPDLALTLGLETARRELGEARAQHRRLLMWAQEFKAIRLQQMDEALQQLEMEVAGRCVELGLVGWSLQFTPDKVTKKGTVTRGFTVTVLSPYNEQAVPWEAWSGGETQRLRLAGQMGLADLVRARTGADLALEVWDEPTQGLSAQGIADLLECLQARALREQRQIWVVDHHSLGHGGFDGVVTVVRGPSGSSLES